MVGKHKPKQYPTKKYLLGIFGYNPKTGMLTWRTDHKKALCGDEAGCLNSLGYKTVRLNYVTYSVHRLIWIMYKRPLPDGLEIDHINGNRADNRLLNLRAVTRSENMRNRDRKAYLKKKKRIGVSASKTKGKWISTASINGKQIYLGTFSNEDEAEQASLNFRLENGFTPRHCAPLFSPDDKSLGVKEPTIKFAICDLETLSFASDFINRNQTQKEDCIFLKRLNEAIGYYQSRPIRN